MLMNSIPLCVAAGSDSVSEAPPLGQIKIWTYPANQRIAFVVSCLPLAIKQSRLLLVGRTYEYQILSLAS